MSIPTFIDFLKENKLLKTELEEEIDELEEHWIEVAENYEEVPVAPYKKDIDLEFFGIAWLPYYLIQVDDRLVEIPAFDSEQ